MPTGDPDILDIIKDPDFFLGKSFRFEYAVRLAEVVSINDEKKKGRVCVRVLGIHPVTNPDGRQVDATMLPWAERLGSFGGGGVGDFALPSVGDIVVVVFLHGNIGQPLWLGTLWKSPKGVSQAPQVFIDEQYAAPAEKAVIQGFVTRAGHKVLVREKQGDREIVVETAGGRKVVIRDDDQAAGSGEKKGVTISCSGFSLKFDEQSAKATLSVTGDVTLDVTGAIKLGSDLLTAITDGIVTRQCACSFTGAPHPDSSAKVMAQK